MAVASGESLEKLDDMIVRAAESTAAHVRAAKEAIAIITAEAGGAEAIGGCARIVLCAIEFQFVTSFACAATGTAYRIALCPRQESV